MIHLSSILVYLWIDITQINFHQFFQRILLNMFKHTITQQGMLTITVLIRQRKCFPIVQIRNCGPTFWNSLDKAVKHCKATKHFRNQLKSIILSEYNSLHSGACLVYFFGRCLFVKCIILQVSVYLCWKLC